MHKLNNYKLGILLSALLIILVALGGVKYVKIVAEKVISQNKIHIEDVTVQISENISSKIESYLHSLDLIAKNLVLNKDIIGEELSKILRFEIESGIFSEILVVDINGYGIDSNNNKVYIGDKKFFRETRQGIITVQEPLDSNIYNENAIIYSIPLISNGDIVGVICAVDDSDLVKAQLETNVYKNQGCYYILSEEGAIVLEKHIGREELEYCTKDIVHEFIEESDSEISKADIKETGVNIKNINGEEKYVSYSKIKSTNDWYVVTATPMSNVFINAQKVIQITMELLKICIVACIILQLYIIKTNHTNKKKLNKAVYEDHLTEINNLEKFIIDGNKCLNKNKNLKYALLLFDIEKFKVINDIYGYQVGDNILKAISKNLCKVFGRSSVYGRLSGDTFGILTEISNIDKDILNLSYKIKEEVANIKNIDSIKLNINIDVSIGVYIVEEHGENINMKKIIDNADMARLKSKSMKHIDYFVFDEAMRKEMKFKMELEQDLSFAIENKQFYVYYQPKFDTISGKIIGSEALLRWEHPTMGFLGPDKFIPIAEKNGYINEIGKWVFSEVCKTLRQWIDEGIEVVPVSVNLSRVEFYQENLINFLEDTLIKHQIPAKLVELEITETSTLNDRNFISDKVYQIRDLGIKVAIDDFGVGSSNIINLKDIPMDVLKIDRSILIDIETNIKSKIVVESIFNVSKHLGLDVVCEGVENMNQVNILKDMGCRIIQGYVFSKPINQSEYKGLLSYKTEENMNNL